jgi:ribonuclease BN (tRNA processing enzyme)
VRITVLGGAGAWPPAGQACSGYLVERDGFRLLIDPGYAIVPQLLKLMPAAAIDAVLVTHGHPDHCADLSPLLRARMLRNAPAPPLPVYSLPGAVDAVLALDPRTGDGCAHHELAPGGTVHCGPFTVDSRLLPHFLPNLGLRLTAGGATLVYTGDAGPSADTVGLADGAALFLAEATYPEQVPEFAAGNLNTARDVGRQATSAGVGRLVLTHLWPGTDPSVAATVAAEEYTGPVDVATVGRTFDLT